MVYLGYECTLTYGFLLLMWHERMELCYWHEFPWDIDPYKNFAIWSSSLSLVVRSHSKDTFRCPSWIPSVHETLVWILLLSFVVLIGIFYKSWSSTKACCSGPKGQITITYEWGENGRQGGLLFVRYFIQSFRFTWHPWYIFDLLNKSSLLISTQLNLIPN